MTNNSLSEVAEILKRAKSVAVLCHVRPDGDRSEERRIWKRW